MHKAGFVNIVGNPNVGKSTLMNALVGEKISIITSKAQTTRHRILGIVNGEDFQIVYSDTPGVLKPNYKMQEAMLEFSKSALTDADVLLYVTDVVDRPEKNAKFVKMVNASSAPVILVINKIDQIDQEQLEKKVEEWKNIIPRAEILPMAALHKFNLEPLLRRIKELLPESPPFFDKDQLTDKPARFFVTEIIREKILLNYDKEIPYSVEVEVERFKEEENITGRSLPMSAIRTAASSRRRRAKSSTGRKASVFIRTRSIPIPSRARAARCSAARRTTVLCRRRTRFFITTGIALRCGATAIRTAGAPTTKSTRPTPGR